MLEKLFGSANKERVLLFISTRKEGYGAEIARFYDTDLYGIQRQLDNLEAAGVFVSKKVGKTRLYRFNPRFALRNELQQLLDKAVLFYPDELRMRLTMNRRRPRGKGKDL